MLDAQPAGRIHIVLMKALIKDENWAPTCYPVSGKVLSKGKTIGRHMIVRTVRRMYLVLVQMAKVVHVVIFKHGAVAVYP